MSGKRGLVMGVANDHSIAWGIAKALAGEGAELAFTYQSDALGKRVAPLAEAIGSTARPSLRRRGSGVGRRGSCRRSAQRGAASIFWSIASGFPIAMS